MMQFWPQYHSGSRGVVSLLKQRVSFVPPKYTSKHNCNALTKLNWDFAIVVSIDINPGQVKLFASSYLRGKGSHNITG